LSGDVRTLRRYRLQLGALVVGVGVTLLATTAPYVPFAFRSGSADLVLETSTALAAALTAYLVLLRFRENKLASDLFLAYPLALFALTHLAVSGFSAVAGDAPDAFRAWASLAAALVGAVVFATAAYIPRRPVKRPEGAGRFAAACALGTLTLVGTLIGLVATHLPVPVDLGDPSISGTRPLIADNSLLLMPQVEIAILFVLAAVGFSRRAEETGDDLLRWLGAGAVLGAFSALHYFLFPSLYSDWVSTGDLLRLGFYTLLFVGAAREIDSYWRSRASAAALEERRRLARDLHDGLAQELAYVARHARKLAAREPTLPARQIAAAAERALDESRRAIAVLTRPLDARLESMLAEAAETAAGRVGTRLHLDLEPGIELGPQAREDLVRIACEAITNAGRHGAATDVSLELRNGDGVRLRVVDNGSGFDPATRIAGGFGLVSMRERAAAHGGDVQIESNAGQGTEVEVVLR
jgi:signal transduction histidine kinase